MRKNMAEILMDSAILGVIVDAGETIPTFFWITAVVVGGFWLLAKVRRMTRAE